MVETSIKSLTLPLKVIFNSMLHEGVFPEDCKKSSVVLIHKEHLKNVIKNYQPISLLLILSRIFERLVFNSLFNCFMQNKLFTHCQSGFIPGNSCVAQLFSVTHEIFKSFDCNPPTDMKGTFFDIFKAFDKVWHENLIFELKKYGVDGNLLKLLENYLTGG